MNKIICFVICFLVGVLIYSLIRSYCGCQVVEGQNSITTTTKLKHIVYHNKFLSNLNKTYENANTNGILLSIMMFPGGIRHNHRWFRFNFT